MSIEINQAEQVRRHAGVFLNLHVLLPRLNLSNSNILVPAIQHHNNVLGSLLSRYPLSPQLDTLLTGSTCELFLSMCPVCHPGLQALTSPTLTLNHWVGHHSRDTSISCALEKGVLYTPEKHHSYWSFKGVETSGVELVWCGELLQLLPAPVLGRREYLELQVDLRCV